MFYFLKEYFEIGLYVVILSIPGISIILISQHLRPWETRTRSNLASLILWSIAGCITFYFSNQSSALVIAFIGQVITFFIKYFHRDYNCSGHIFLASGILGLILGVGWGIFFILTANISIITSSLMFIGLFSLIFTAPIGIITLLPTQSYLFRKRWNRPRQPLEPVKRVYYPKISLHLPTYAEPPDIVCSTLDALSRLKYPNFEVIVIDNNTKDKKFWLPVKKHCSYLGSRFRFFHVDFLKGAKAGALNFSLRRTAQDAEIVGIVDSDYHAEPDFLDKLIGFFDDPRVGFVQTPHDYREWELNRFQRNCYWEYMPAYRLEIACLNEWVASYIIGTMCLIRRHSLEEAGGWAEWCLTEDSECAVRIHALGYVSIFVTQTAGRGLIPESFFEYKKQRLRWTIGPIQQMKKHWRMFLPRRFSITSKLTRWQRLLEFSHSLKEVSSIITTIFIPIGLANLGSLIYHRESVTVPTIIWIASAVALPSLLSVRWLTFRLANCYSIVDMIGAIVASLSLTHIRLVGSIMAWSRKEFVWRRTCKNKLLPNSLQTLQSAGTELILAVIFITLGWLTWLNASTKPPDLVFLASLGLFSVGIVYLTAPAMAILGEYHLYKQQIKAKIGTNLKS